MNYGETAKTFNFLYLLVQLELYAVGTMRLSLRHQGVILTTFQKSVT